MDKEKLEELKGLKEDIKNKYEENFKLNNNSVIIILDEDEDAESTVEFVTIINLIINLGEKYNYTFIGISQEQELYKTKKASQSNGNLRGEKSLFCIKY